MVEILFNSKINNYTLEEEIEGVKSVKKIPMKYKVEDKTSRFRKDLLKDEILSRTN